MQKDNFPIIGDTFVLVHSRKFKAMKKRILMYSILNIIVIALLGGNVLFAYTSPPVNDDPITGMYYLQGTKTIKMYPGWPSYDAEPNVDITSIASVVNIRLVEEKTDTLLFYGLPGADEGKIGIYFGQQSTEYVYLIEMYDERDDHRVYAQFDDTTFEIDINNTGNMYRATGTIENGVIELKGRFQYRNRTFEYDLKGIKIEQ